ncbi:MAG: T9SS type A sorting domain-containing protein [Bacteroidetes bacterium]|nr:T9SS type A sorting domain-containing protein [Bacteroidota bacterium]
MNFLTDSCEITTVDRDMNYFRTVANITDAEGNLLFSTNGVRIADATGNTMQNGDGLNPSWYTSQVAQHPDGSMVPQGCLILPKPGSTNVYYLFHGTLDDPATTTAHYLYMTTVDMTLNDGLGAVVTKNQVIINDTLNVGRITAVRHANGRDWWVFCHKVDTNMYYRVLVTPYGVLQAGVQSIGLVRPRDFGQACFSPAGDRFAYWAYNYLEVFDVDRCTGLFSNAIQAHTTDTLVQIGAAFSPNGHYIYITAGTNVYQYDAEAVDFSASQVHVAHWDSTYSPFPPFATMFDIAQLAPNGKIYIATGNSTLRLHVINNPDEADLACNMVQHGVVLPRYYSNSLPNHPNYHLGAVEGSVCDSLGLGAGINAALSGAEGRLRAAPNPSDGQFMLGYPANTKIGWLEVRNLAGQVVLRERIPQWSTVHEVDLKGEALGMYQCSLRWGAQVLTTRVVLTGSIR